MKILNKLKRSNGVRVGLCLAACVLGSRDARAEIELVEKDGWTFSFEGRVNAFMSGGKGDDLPTATAHPDPAAAPHHVMGADSSANNGVPDVGWPANYGASDENNKFVNIRVRSGMYGNILGFGLARQAGETTLKAYVSIWSTVESLGMDKWAPVTAVVREGYLNASGDWGSLRIGRMLTWMGRSSYEIDTKYGHGFGVGLPCTDSLGPACGHIGTGALQPGYGAGISYGTPSLGGLKLTVGLYDPVVFAQPSAWDHAPFVRPEGQLAFDRRIGEKNRIKVSVEGAYQPLSRIVQTTDPTTMVMTESKTSTAAWGVSGGLRLELGPVRLGVSGFHGRGVGLFYAFQNTQATEDGSATHELRKFTGGYGQAALVFGKVQLSGGFGLSLVEQTAADKINGGLSVIRYQRGISGGFYYFATDSIVIGLDYFMFAAGWWGAPLVDPTTMTNTGKLAGETQVVHFVNAGVTYHW